MLWLYLLAAVTALIIALRRVLRRLGPLREELYTTKVAIEHVHAGVVFIKADGKVGFVNQSLADSLLAKPSDLAEREWLLMFPNQERAKVEEAYNQMLLQGIANLETSFERSDGTHAPIHLRLVTAHNQNMRVLGHHCLIRDDSQLRALKQKVAELTAALERSSVTETR
jgi:PAS domain S-box-containing protein